MLLLKLEHSSFFDAAVSLWHNRVSWVRCQTRPLPADGKLLLLVEMRSHCLTWVTYCARHTVLEPMSVSLSVQRSHCLRLGAEHSNLESGRIEFSKQLLTVKGRST
jgi:hypothetical protein